MSTPTNGILASYFSLWRATSVIGTLLEHSFSFVSIPKQSFSFVLIPNDSISFQIIIYCYVSIVYVWFGIFFGIVLDAFGLAIENVLDCFIGLS